MPSLGGGWTLAPMLSGLSLLAVGLLGKLPSLSLSRAATMPSLGGGAVGLLGKLPLLSLGGGWTVAPAAFSFFGAEAPMTLGGVTAIAFWRWTKELWPII